MVVEEKSEESVAVAKEPDAEEPNAKDARHTGKEANAHSAIAMALGATFVPSRAIDVDSAVIGAGWVIGESLASHKEVEAIEDDDCAVINPDAPE